MAEQTEWLLLSHLPTKDNNPIGLVHGDYQPGNLLFHDGRVSGVIDWELSGIGGSLLDVGWLMMMSDRTGWSLLSDPMPALDPALIQDMYEARMERAFRALSWFRAYAGFRMGSIACLNVRLHRKGQRNDPIWESLALGIPEFFGNARALLEGRR